MFAYQVFFIPSYLFCVHVYYFKIVYMCSEFCV